MLIIKHTGSDKMFMFAKFFMNRLSCHDIGYVNNSASNIFATA